MIYNSELGIRNSELYCFEILMKTKAAVPYVVTAAFDTFNSP